jgi:hypothetical protein
LGFCENPGWKKNKKLNMGEKLHFVEIAFENAIEHAEVDYDGSTIDIFRGSPYQILDTVRQFKVSLLFGIFEVLICVRLSSSNIDRVSETYQKVTNT